MPDPRHSRGPNRHRKSKHLKAIKCHYTTRIRARSVMLRVVAAPLKQVCGLALIRATEALPRSFVRGPFPLGEASVPPLRAPNPRAPPPYTHPETPPQSCSPTQPAPLKPLWRCHVAGDRAFGEQPSSSRRRARPARKVDPPATDRPPNVPKRPPTDPFRTRAILAACPRRSAA